jgi:hypothetical protein
MRDVRDVPFVSFSTRLDLPTTELRRRLERVTGLPASRLITEALHALEQQLGGNKESTKA